MADVVNILWNAETAEASPRTNGFSGVRIIIGTDDDGNTREITAGDMNGNVLEIKNPFGTQQMANDILEDVRGYQYQPLDATGALMNPAAEMGDGVSVNGIYTGLYIRATKFGRLMKSDIGAPTNQEIEHEYAVESATDRQYTRFVRDTKAMLRITNMAIEAEVERVDRDVFDENNPTSIKSTLNIQADEIAAKVSQTGGSNTSNSFSWSLKATGHYWYANGSSDPVFSITKDGARVRGEIRATKGVIGGFTIGQSAIYNNISSFNGSQSTGVYVGTNGIQLGQGFKVNPSGYMTLRGSIEFRNDDGSYAGTLSASSLRQGALDGYNWNHQYQGEYGGTAANYAINGAGAGYTANSTWDNAFNSNRGVGTIYASGFHSFGNVSASGHLSGSDISIGNSMYLGTTYITTEGGTYLVVGSKV